MSLTIHYSNAYSFLGGLFVGKFTNIWSDVVIGGLILYIVNPEIYTQNRWERLKSYVWNWVSPKKANPDNTETEKTETPTLSIEMSKFINFNPLPKIEVLSSPKNN